VGSVTILLVEDDVDVRAVLTLMLQAPERHILVAAAAPEAIELARSTSVDLFLIDVILPVIGGRELGDQLRREHPGARVLYMSGWYDHPEFPQLEDAPVLQKPFSRDRLNAAIAELLQD
jgi:two-component system, cell cycle sensor histidine kinase and response regulator CckA